MPQTNYTDLTGEILPWCPGVSSVMVKDAVRRSVRYLCQETDVLKITSDPLLSITVDEPCYSIEDPVGTEIVRVLEVFVDGEQLVHRTEQQLDLDNGESGNPVVLYKLAHDSPVIKLRDPWRKETSWPVAYWYQERPRTIRLVPIPSQSLATGMEITVSVKPNLVSTSAETFIIENWYETIVKGSVAYLLSLPKRGWTDARESKAKRQEFENEVSAINDELVAGFHHNSQSVGRIKAHP